MLHWRELPGRLPAGFLCPVVLRGLEEHAGWQTLARDLGDLGRLERRANPMLTFDASDTGSFMYWDNSSVMASHVRKAGRVRQNYQKVTAPPRAFFSALRAGGGDLGSVRFGKKVAAYSAALDAEVRQQLESLAPAAKDPTRTLWISAPGSQSTAHQDSFFNTFVMFAGQKRWVLSSPLDAHLFKVFPGTHPNARQARAHFDEKLGSDKVTAVTLKAGEALFLPATYFHHVQAVGPEPAVAVALTALPPEHLDFNKWMTSSVPEQLPFLSEPGVWDTRRFAAAMTAFTPELVKAMGYSDLPASQDPLHVLVNVSYEPVARRDWGIEQMREPYPFCERPAAADRQAVARAAREVAARFSAFPAQSRALYFQVYLENVLSRLGGSLTDPAEIFSAELAFIEDCLAHKRGYA